MGLKGIKVHTKLFNYVVSADNKIKQAFVFDWNLPNTLEIDFYKNGQPKEVKCLKSDYNVFYKNGSEQITCYKDISRGPQTITFYKNGNVKEGGYNTHMKNRVVAARKWATTFAPNQNCEGQNTTYRGYKNGAPKSVRFSKDAKGIRTKFGTETYIDANVDLVHLDRDGEITSVQRSVCSH